MPEQKHSGYLNEITCNHSNSQYCMTVGSVGNRAILYKTVDGGLNWVAREFTTQSGAEKGGLTYTPIRGVFNSITCSNNGVYCTIIGYATYRVSKPFDKEIKEMVLPVIYRSLDEGYSWSRRWPDFSNENGLIHSVSNLGSDITGYND